MKTFIITALSLSALSSAALAERSYDLRDAPQANGQSSMMTDERMSSDIVPLAAIKSTKSAPVLYGKYGTTMDPAELRRWDEKNGG